MPYYDGMVGYVWCVHMTRVCLCVCLVWKLPMSWITRRNVSSKLGVISVTRTHTHTYLNPLWHNQDIFMLIIDHLCAYTIFCCNPWHAWHCNIYTACMPLALSVNAAVCCVCKPCWPTEHVCIYFSYFRHLSLAVHPSDRCRLVVGRARLGLAASGPGWVGF